MQTRFISAILLIVFLSACSPAPLPTVTPQPILAPTSTALPPLPTITPDADALRLWGDKDASVAADRLGKGTAYAMALSPDGKTIAVSGLVSVSTYDFDSLHEIWTSLLEPSQPPLVTGRGQVVWSPDGSQLATRSEVGITVWDAKTGQQLLIFKGDQYDDEVIWTRDGRLAALEYSFGNETLWYVQTGEELFKIETNDAPGASDLLQDQGLLAESLNRGVVVWDTHSKQELYSPLKVCDGYCVNSLKLSPDGTRAAVAATDERDRLSVWDLKTGEQLFVTEAPGNYAGTEFVWAPDGRYLAAAFNTGTIGVWDAQTGKTLQTLSVDKIEEIAWSLDGENLITLSQYESLTVWDVKTGQASRSLGEHTSWVMDLVWSPDGSMLAAGTEAGEVIIREAASGKLLKSFHDQARYVSNLTWSPTGREIASNAENAIRIWDVDTGEQVRSWRINSQTMFGLVWSPDGRMLASVSYEGTVTLWDASTGEQLRSLPTYWSSADLVWSPQGDLLSSSYPHNDVGGEQVTLWNPHTGEAVLSKQGVHGLAWAPSGDRVASISDNGTGFARDDTTLVLWDPRTGTEIRSFNLGTFLTHVGWSPDGNYLVVSGSQEADEALVVLDAETGEQLHRLRGHYYGISNVAWSPRGDFIASSSSDGTVIIWRVKAIG